jgi:hypothetical protein
MTIYQSLSCSFEGKLPVQYSKATNWSTQNTYGAAHRGHAVLAREVLAQPEVDHLDATGVSFRLQHEVFGLDVSKRA